MDEVALVSLSSSSDDGCSSLLAYINVVHDAVEVLLISHGTVARGDFSGIGSKFGGDIGETGLYGFDKLWSNGFLDVEAGGCYKAIRNHSKFEQRGH